MSEEVELWRQMYAAAKAVQKPRQISPNVDAGGVAAAVAAPSGKIFTGVCVDTACSLGTCAERAAIFSLITAGENAVQRVLAIMGDGSVGPPCGACRELLGQLMMGRLGEVKVLLSYPKIRTVSMAELLPDWWLGGG